MPYKTPWGETRYTRKEISQAANIAAQVAGADLRQLTTPFKPGDLVETTKGPGTVVKCVGSMFVSVEIQAGHLRGQVIDLAKSQVKLVPDEFEL